MIGRLLLAVLFLVAGSLHFFLPAAYLKIVPPSLPAHLAIVYVSGAAEIAGGLGILIPQTRRAAAWGLVIFLIVVMPANIWMAQHPERYPGIALWAIWLRLPLQLPLIWWAWRYTRPPELQS